MKTLSNHTILYDAECPMCSLYSKAFVRSGMLDAAGRASYQEMPANACPLVDQQRAVDEIALVNNQTGEVSYGIHSLFKVLANSFPIFKPLFLFRPFEWLMSKCYAFISYNRRAIIPPLHSAGHAFKPTFNKRYRIAFLVFTWAVTSLILSSYAQLLAGILPTGSAYREYLVCGGQIMFQGIIVSLAFPAKKWDYLGNMMAISFAGALLLLPGLIVAHFIALPPLAFAACFLAVAGLMFLEHIRRAKLLAIGWALTITWALYQIVVLYNILSIRI